MKEYKFVFVALAFVAFISCSNFEYEDYGTVVFDLAEEPNLRAVNPSNGLPILINSGMKIIVESDGNRVKVKEFSEQSKKQYKETFPVGAKIKVTAIVMTKGSKWQGSIKHTVTSGINSLDIKLKKAAQALEPLKFKLFKEGTESKFDLGFLKGPNFFNDNVSGTYTGINLIPAFCRDQVGRTYMLYRDGTPLTSTQFKRYTSEGTLDNTFMSPTLGVQDDDFLLASDHKTGNIFVSYKVGGTANYDICLLRGERPTSLKPILNDNIYSIQALGVYNNALTIIEDGNDCKLYIYKVDGDKPLSKKAEMNINELLKIKVKDDLSILQKAKVMDCYMTNKDIYILYDCYTKTSPYISVGGILKVSYTNEKNMIKLEESKKLIGRDEYIKENNIINVKDETKELYGPQKFVGFDEDVLYIADSGVIYANATDGSMIKTKKNRLVGFNLKNKKISIERKDGSIEPWIPKVD